MRLLPVQEHFKRFLFDGDASIAHAIITTPSLDAYQRLRIYANAYRSRLVDALSGDFPALRAVMGERAFAELSGRYIGAHPSRSFTLRGYGARLPEFVEAEAEMPDRARLAELAHFEWAMVEAFDAPDDAVATAEDAMQIQRDAWPGLRIVVHPSLHLVDLRFGTVTVWDAVKAGKEITLQAEHPSAAGCFIWRRGLTTQYRAIERVERAAWSALVAGDFSTMCESLLDSVVPEEIGQRAALLLRTWLDDGLICRLRAP